MFVCIHPFIHVSDYYISKSLTFGVRRPALELESW